MCENHFVYALQSCGWCAQKSGTLDDKGVTAVPRDMNCDSPMAKPLIRIQRECMPMI